MDKSHICVPFWRLLIVLNRRNYSQGTAVLAIQRCWWPDCTLCCVKSCLVFHQPYIFSSTLHRLPILSNATRYELCIQFASMVCYPALFYLRYLNARGDKSQGWSPPLPASMHTLLPAPSGSYMGPHLFLLPAEKGRDGHYALLQSRASDVALACLLNTLQCPACMNRDDEISWISEQEWATSICLALPIYAQQFPRWLFKLHRDFPWIIHYLPSISMHSNGLQISSCHTQGNKSICQPIIIEMKCYTASNNVISKLALSRI